MTLTIRPATDTDKDAVIALLRELYRFFDADEGLAVERHARRLFPVSASRRTTLVATDDRTPVGFATFEVVLREKSFALAVEDLCVSQPSRGRGVGRSLVAALRDEATRRGCRSIRWTLDDRRPYNPDEDDHTILETREMFLRQLFSITERWKRRRKIEDHWRQLEAAGIAPPTITDRRDDILANPQDDLLSEGDVPFAILPDDRVIRARFRTTELSGVFGADNRTTWTLTLDGRDFAVLRSRGAEPLISSSWFEGSEWPQRTHAHEGNQAVRYEYFYAHHLGSTMGHITYVFDVVAMTVRAEDDLKFDPD